MCMFRGSMHSAHTLLLSHSPSVSSQPASSHWLYAYFITLSHVCVWCVWCGVGRIPSYMVHEHACPDFPPSPLPPPSPPVTYPHPKCAVLISVKCHSEHIRLPITCQRRVLWCCLHTVDHSGWADITLTACHTLPPVASQRHHPPPPHQSTVYSTTLCHLPLAHHHLLLHTL